MTSGEIERLRSHVTLVLAWRKAEEVARLGPDISGVKEYSTNQAWLAKHRKPSPNLTPSDLIFDLSRFESLLGMTVLGQNKLKSYHGGLWVNRYREAYKRLRRFGKVVPSLKTEPGLKRLIDPTPTQAYDGLAAIEDWCRDAADAMKVPSYIIDHTESTETPEKFMPASWFRDEFGIDSERLRAARRRGKLPAINVSTSEVPIYRYSAIKAQELWPADVEYLPQIDRFTA
ncbi:MAG: hypothetical protein AAF911_03425 [Planctomycetota bacterium]